MQSLLLSLPVEILLETLSHLPPEALHAFALTCRQAYGLLEDDESWPAWKGAYCSTFDDPADSGWPVAPQSPGKAGRDWRSLTQVCFQAARALLEKRLGTETETTIWLALLHLLYTSPPSGSPSKNLSVLYPRLLPSLLDFPLGHGARPLLSQLILHLDHLASWAWDDPIAELGQARTYVYDLSKYAPAPDFGPYFVGFGFSSDPDDDGGVKVRGADWEKVNAIAQIMGANLRSSAESGDWDGNPEDIPSRADYARPGSQRKPVDGLLGIPGDWAAISGGWQGTYAFMDYPEFIAFNMPRLTRQRTRMSLDNYDEVVGNAMNLDLVPAIPSPGATSPGSRLKSYTFSGTSHNPLVGTSRVDGVVIPMYPPAHPSALASFVNPPQETRVSMTISYNGQARWQLEGILLEGGRGIVGVWTEHDRERGSPCGPFHYFRRSPDEDEDNV